MPTILRNRLPCKTEDKNAEENFIRMRKRKRKRKRMMMMKMRIRMGIRTRKK